MWLAHLDGGELVGLGGSVRVQLVVEEFGAHWHEGLHVAQLVPWVETVGILFLELLIALRWAKWLLDRRHRPPLGSPLAFLLHGCMTARSAILAIRIGQLR